MFNWYRIPGFECYDINKHTRQVRSSKHYKRDKFHIMKVRSGKITIVNDYGVPTTISVDDLYDITFGGENPLNPVGDNEYWANTMSKTCRNLKSNIDILGGVYESIDQPNNEFTLDFSNINRSINVVLTKPFYCDPYKD